MENPQETIDWMISELTVINAIKKEKLSGCTNSEIQQLLIAQNIDQFPPIYEYFLRRMGKVSGAFMSGTFLYYPDLITLKHEAVEMIRDHHDKNFTFKPNTFVFWLNVRGLEFMWFENHKESYDIFY